MNIVRFEGRLCILAIGALLSFTTGCDEPSAATAASAKCNSEGGPVERGRDARLAESATRSDGVADVRQREPRGEAGACPTLLFSETFETSAAGAALAPAWALVIEGPNSSARVNLDAEGHGNAASNRFALFTNAGSYPKQVEISATRGPFDLRGCAGATLTASVIVFSLELAENDHAFVEVRGSGSDWIPVAMPYPSSDFPTNAACRAGGQETGCTAWRTLVIDVPRVALGADTEVRFRSMTLTDVSDFFGFDDVSLAGVL